MSAITVTARAQAKPGKEKDLEAALRAVTIATHGEPGCLRYAVHRNRENPAVFLVVERWSSIDAHNAHMTTPHVQDLFRKVPDLVAAPPEILTFEGLDMGKGEKGRL
jgi:quinol monooxygenase YgiN